MRNTRVYLLPRGIIMSIHELRIWKPFVTGEVADITSLSAALLSGAVVYAVCSFFFHMAYSGTLPLIAGQSLALYFAAKQRMEPAEARLA